MHLRTFLWILLTTSLCRAADTVAVMPLFNVNEAKSPNLDWIGESVAETIHESLSSAGLLVLAREDRAEIYRRLSVKPGVVLTKASVIKIGESLDAGQVVYGDFNVEGSENGAGTVKSKIHMTVRVIDLKKLREDPPFEQTGILENLSQMEMKLAYMVLKRISPEGIGDEASFLRDRTAVRVDAMESYVRGLMAASVDQRIKLFGQALRIDDKFSPPAFQLGKILAGRKEYKTAGQWLAKVSRTDSHYMEAQFLLGICRYQEGDFDAAVQQFRTVLPELPLNEVYNNLGAALSRKDDRAALDNFSKALEGDPSDPDYWFNVGFALWKRGDFAQAAERFRAVLDRSREDREATSMLGRCIKMDGPHPGDTRTEGHERIKTAFEDSAFRQLQAELKGAAKKN